jgi:hypothetical protein
VEPYLHQPKQGKPSSKEYAFIRTLREILDNTRRSISSPLIQFEFSMEVATKNWETISRTGGLISKLIKESPFSPLTYGSEFKESWRLEPILHDHHLWKRFRNILDNGSTFPLLDPLPDKTRLRDFDEMLSYKNHKSAVLNKDILNDHLRKEVEKGWLIPLRPCDARQLRNASIAPPMGVISQSNDLFFPGPISGSSINSRTQMELLEPCYYGHMLIRMIHQIVAYRAKFPSSHIVLQKLTANRHTGGCI